MTLPDAEKVMTSLERWGPRIVPLSAVGTCLCLAGFAYLQVQVSDQASAGDAARTRQQAVFPVSVKLYTWAAKDPKSGITARDLACFKSGKGCPTSKRTP